MSFAEHARVITIPRRHPRKRRENLTTLLARNGVLFSSKHLCLIIEHDRDRAKSGFDQMRIDLRLVVNRHRSYSFGGFRHAAEIIRMARSARP